MFHGNFYIKIHSQIEEMYADTLFIPYLLCATVAIKMTT